MYGHVIFKTEKHGLKHVAVADLLLEDGRTLRLQDTFASLPEIDDYERLHPLDPIYVEGFYLKDGAGLFWISYAATRNGETLITREERARMLIVSRQTFGKVLLWMYLYVISPFWIISYFNIRKVRISLGTR